MTTSWSPNHNGCISALRAVASTSLALWSRSEPDLARSQGGESESDIRRYVTEKMIDGIGENAHSLAKRQRAFPLRRAPSSCRGRYPYQSTYRPAVRSNS